MLFLITWSFLSYHTTAFSFAQSLQNTVVYTMQKPEAITEENLKNINHNIFHEILISPIRCNDTIMNNFSYDDYLIKALNYKLYKGRNIGNDSEILITRKASSKYSVGDTVNIEYFSPTGNTITSKKTIVGILDNDCILYPFTTSCKMNYSDFIIDTEKTTSIVDFQGGAIICTDSALRGNSIPSIPMYFVDKNIIKNGKVLNINLSDYGYLNRGEDILANSEPRYTDTLKDIIMLCVNAFLIFVAGFCGYGHFDMWYRRSEPAIYYLCGMSHKHSFILMTVQNFILMAIGCLLGTLLGSFLINYTNLDGIFHFSYIIVILLFMLITWIITFVPNFLFLKNNKISELLREK